jgi:hypothetical protein
MRLRDKVLGTLSVFGSTVGRLNDEDLALAQAMVHVASVAIVSEKSASDRDVVNAQLQHALTSRIVLEQAKGVLASVGHLEMEDAFKVLGRYTRDHHRKLRAVAEQLVSRELRGQELLDYARSCPDLPPINQLSGRGQRSGPTRQRCN